MSAPRAFIAGWPVSHSLSPVLHGFWLARHGLAGSYERVPVEPGSEAAFFAGLRASDYAGGNVTLPHKLAALAAADHATAEARAVGAANTLWLADGRLHADNTDTYGFAANLDQNAPGWDGRRQALVLGAGGGARAVLHALATRGLQVTLVNRTRAKADGLAAAFGPAVTAQDWEALPALLARAELLVNTTALGMTGQPPLAIALDGMPRDGLVTDIVYAPLVTPLLAQAQARGLTTVDGLGMLLHQAVPAFERFFGLRPAVDEALRAHLLATLAARHG